MRILLCGGGVIGASIAYFLTRRGAEVVVIERTGIACAASGKSGGFLALDWCDGSPLEALARRSFALHADLAREVEGAWGYRGVPTFGGFAAPRSSGRRGNAYGLDWLSDSVALDRRLGTSDTTAQVDPAAFTSALMRAAAACGAKLRLGCVTGIVRRTDGKSVAGVEVDGEMLAADAVVIAMGPWSILACRWLPLPAVFGLKGHSVVYRTEDSVPAGALFLEYQEGSGTWLSPEVFPRSDGTTYVCGLSSEQPLPLDPSDVRPEPGAIERMEDMCHRLSPRLNPAKVLARQACYRPVTQDGLPLIGCVPGVRGAYIATGHSVWGILNAPATGEAVAELILDGGARSSDLSPFDPARLPPAEPGDWQVRAST